MAPVRAVHRVPHNGLSFTTVLSASSLDISRRTLYQRCKEANVLVTYRCDPVALTDDEIDGVVQNLKKSMPNTGERLVIGHFRAIGMCVSRERIRKSIHRADPLNTALRWNYKIHRRVYSVAGPNSLWHIGNFIQYVYIIYNCIHDYILIFLDGNHKLIRWKLVIHGGIDGYSRLIVFLACSNNNRADTVVSHFTQACFNYFIPSRVRCDRGGENVEVARFVLSTRGFDRGSVISGTSVHNQHIERLWRDLFEQVTSQYYHLFYNMEEAGLLDLLNDQHLLALHYTFLPRINKSLNLFVNIWNQHPVSGQSNRSPVQMFTVGIQKLLNDGKIA